MQCPKSVCVKNANAVVKGAKVLSNNVTVEESMAAFLKE